MTKVVINTVQCFVCGATNEQRQLLSTIEQGYPDLDGRPPEMARSAMPLWVKTCSQCGYCAPDLSGGHEAFRALVRSKAYQEQLHAPDTPELANRFLCAAMLCDSTRRDVDAARHRLHATWAADDAGKSEFARQYRSSIADMLLAQREALRAWKSGNGEWKGAEAVFLVDLLRRANRFDEALRELEAALQQGVSTMVRELLIFERSVISRRDADTHWTGEAFGQPAVPENPIRANPLLAYIFSHYGDFITPQEREAARTRLLRTSEGERWETNDPQVLTLLANGKQAFISALEKRLLTDHPGQVFINRCPKCGGVTRTPKARQCRFCHHSWHNPG